MPLIRTLRVALLAGWAVAVLLAVVVIGLALQVPSLGIRFGVDASGAMVIVQRSLAGSGLPVGARVRALIDASGQAFELVPGDLIEEPDFHDTYAGMEVFLGRQGRLADIVRSGQVRVVWQGVDGGSGVAVLDPRPRRVADLPLMFWFQLGVGVVGLTVGGWLLVLRPREWGVRMFALTGVGLALSSMSAAIYSTRELALPEGWFRALSAINHLGATWFGMALVGLFLCYPKKLVRMGWLLLLPAVFVPWYLADVLRWAPDMDWGVRIPLFIELVMAVAAAGWQWRISRYDPLARAALQWLVLATIVASGLFLALVPGHSVLGLVPPLQQGHAFGFFLIMYLGVVLGLQRFRLFEIDTWAYRVWLWVLGASTVLLLDLLLVLAGLQQTASLGLSLLLAGWLYFPLRQWLWRRIVRRREIRLETLLPQVSEFAFLPTGNVRENHWDSVLCNAFDPLAIQRLEQSAVLEPKVVEDGLGLIIPAVADLQGRCLRHAHGGSRLFSNRDAALGGALVSLVERILASRDSYEQGVHRERQRLARDLHDNLGARLLRLIHHLRGSPAVDLARDAMQELRAAIAAIDAAPATLTEALADWRAETEARCTAAQVNVDWQQGTLPSVQILPRAKAALGAVMREALTNALKHARLSTLCVRVEADDVVLRVRIANDGVDLPVASWHEGYGLRNMRARLRDIGGKVTLEDGPNGWVSVVVEVALSGLKA